MQKALILILILVAAVFVVGCNPPTQSESTVTKSAGAMNPDGTKSDKGGGQTLQAAK